MNMRPRTELTDNKTSLPIIDIRECSIFPGSRLTEIQTMFTDLLTKA